MKTKILSKMRRNIHQFNSRSINPIVVLALFILITWASRFYYFTQFGIYEDDHYRVPVAMAWNWSEFWQFLSLLPSNLIQMNGQGRMLHPALIQTFSFLGEQLGGLSAIYLFGFCIVATNTILFYYLLKRLYNQPIFVIAGTLTFALFPADTTQAFLTHALGVQPALMLLLIAFHLYISKRRSFTFLSYLCIFTSLFIYEKFFLVFLAAPLLKQSPKSLKRELIQHSMLLSGAFIAVAIARRLQGESRIAELNLSTFIKIITDTILGPLVSIGTFIIRPVNAIADFNMAWLIPLAAGCIAIAYLISQSPFFDRARQAITFSPDDGDSNKLQSEQSRIFRELARWALIGLVMLMLAYPLTLIGEVIDIDGRASRVHVAAIIGASILWACVCTAIAFIASRYQKRQLANLGLAIYFTLLLGFGLTIQQDFKTAWQYQRAFWTDVVNLCPDMTYGTVILIEDYGLKEPKQILTRGYQIRVLDSIYQFPQAWGGFLSEGKLFSNEQTVYQPVIYRLKRTWQENIAVSNSNTPKLKLTKATIVHHPNSKGILEVDSLNTIVLQAHNGRFHRRTEPLQINNQAVPIKQNNTNLKPPVFEPGILYPYLIQQSNEPRLLYLKGNVRNTSD